MYIHIHTLHLYGFIGFARSLSLADTFPVLTRLEHTNSIATVIPLKLIWYHMHPIHIQIFAYPYPYPCT